MFVKFLISYIKIVQLVCRNYWNFHLFIARVSYACQWKISNNLLSFFSSERKRIYTNLTLRGHVLLPMDTEDTIPVTRASVMPSMPTCFYSIHMDNPTGPLIRIAKVGQKVYHKWECEPTSDGGENFFVFKIF